MFVLKKLLLSALQAYLVGDFILICGCEIGYWCLCLRKL